MRRIKIQINRPYRYKTRRINIGMRDIIVPFNVMEVYRFGNAIYLIEIAHIPP